MNWLNYHHLFYFWTMAHEGSVSKAAERLHLSQPTISGQLRQLESAVGEKLYKRAGRRLQLTETGRVVFEYAEEIFSTGEELMKRLKRGKIQQAQPFFVGISDFFPEQMAFCLIEPVFRPGQRVRLSCLRGKLPELLADLAAHRLDVVLSDSPVDSRVSGKACSHALGECGVSWVTSQAKAAELRQGFPGSLRGQPLLLPAQNTLLRRSVEHWMESLEFEPEIGAEIEDHSLMKILASKGFGIAPVADSVLIEMDQQHGLHRVGPLAGAKMQFFAISIERRMMHPAIQAVTNEASLRKFFKSTENSSCVKQE